MTYQKGSNHGYQISQEMEYPLIIHTGPSFVKILSFIKLAKSTLIYL
jgi:hypothetical protein